MWFLPAKKTSFFKASAVAYYQEPVASLLHNLKYQGDMAALPALKEVVALGPPFILEGDERIVPVPLHIKRLRQQGGNQAVLIAELFFPNNKALFLVDGLKRIRHTSAQTGLDGTARRKNLRGALVVLRNGDVCGKKVVLVDDVLTLSAGFITFIICLFGFVQRYNLWDFVGGMPIHPTTRLSSI